MENIVIVADVLLGIGMHLHVLDVAIKVISIQDEYTAAPNVYTKRTVPFVYVLIRSNE